MLLTFFSICWANIWYVKFSITIWNSSGQVSDIPAEVPKEKLASPQKKFTHNGTTFVKCSYLDKLIIVGEDYGEAYGDDGGVTVRWHGVTLCVAKASVTTCHSPEVTPSSTSATSGLAA